MSTYTLGSHLSSTSAVDLGPALVSELPAGTPTDGQDRVGLLARLRSELAGRRALRQFDRVLGSVDSSERGDLLALARRS